MFLWKAHQALFQGAGALDLRLQLIEVGGPLGALREASTRLHRYGNTPARAPTWRLQLQPALMTAKRICRRIKLARHAVMVRGVYQAGGLIEVSAAEEALHQLSHLLHIPQHRAETRRLTSH